MATPSDPKPPQSDASATHSPPNALTEAAIAQTLQQGIDLLNQRRYEAAIAPFTSVVEAAGQTTMGWQAQMGLVKAYDRLGDPAAALAWCDRLEHSPAPQVQQWAANSRAKLQAKYPEAIAPEAKPETGFIPLDSLAAAANLTGSDRASALSGQDDAGTNGTPVVESTAIDPPPLDPMPSSPASATSPDPAMVADSAPADAMSPAPRFHAADDAADNTADNAIGDAAATPMATGSAMIPISSYRLRWRNGDRAKRWQPLPRIHQRLYWLSFGVTVVFALVGLRTIFTTICTALNRLIFLIDWPINFRYMWWLELDPLLPLIIYFIAVAVVCPWMWDWLILWRYGGRSLDLETLKTHSDEAGRVIQRFRRQHQWRVPQLYLLNTTAPVIFSYGYPRWFTRIVLSQGLLAQLEADEIAVLVARELDQLQHGDGICLSVISLAAQLPYQIYWVVADWGDRQHNRLLRGLARVVSALSYGFYSAIRWTSLGLARQRVWQSDRAAVGLTGNPNALIRAVLKLAQGTAQTIIREGHTSTLLESLDSLMPLGYRASVTVGSLLPTVPIPDLLQWETQQLYRDWLAINSPHPPLGDRLHQVERLAVQLRLEPEITLPTAPVPKATSFPQWLGRWGTFFFQVSPWTGACIGAVIATLLQWLGKFAWSLRLYSLDWLGRDRDLVTIGILLGLGIGIWWRINALFPDVIPATINPASSVASVTTDPNALPITPDPVKLQGRLLGRSGLQNSLGQDLLIHTEQGLVKLHYAYLFGPLGNLVVQASPLRPDALLGRQVLVQGWLRRGLNPWLDLEKMASKSHQVVRANPPVGETVLGAIAIAWALFLLLQIG